MRVLLLESDLSAARAVEESLRESKVVRADGGESVLKLVHAYNPDVILVGSTSDGLYDLNLIRDAKVSLPVLVLGESAIGSKLLAFSLGADDYLVKPFDPRELAARVNALVRRSQKVKSPDSTSVAVTGSVIVAGKLTLDRERIQIKAGDIRVRLSSKGFKILALLASRPGVVFSREEILNIAWERGNIVNRNVDTAMKRIRRALKGTVCENYVRTIYGGGYCVNPGEE